MDIGTVIKERRALLGISQQDLGLLWSRHLYSQGFGARRGQSVVTDTTEDTGCGGYGNGVAGKTDR